MFIPYKIKSDEIKSLTTGYYNNDEFLKYLRRLKELIGKDVTDEQIKSRFVNGTNLQEQWFPTDFDNWNFDVFISHSHKDINTHIKPLASWLWEHLGLRCFIDSLLWEYADRLLYQIDSIYAYNSSSKTYNYLIRNYTTAHVHAMLSMALMKMMDKTECVLFVDSDNSLTYQKGQAQTPSPWIYEEIFMANNLRIKIPEHYLKKIIPLYESGGLVHSQKSLASSKMKILYDIDTTRFYELRAVDFKRCARHHFTREDALDLFHSQAINNNKLN